MKGQLTTWYEHKYRIKVKKIIFVCQLKINYLAIYATLLNKTTKTTEQIKKLNENKPKRYKNNHNSSTQVLYQLNENPLVC